MDGSVKEVEMEKEEAESVEEMDVGERKEVSAEEQIRILETPWAEMMEDEEGEFEEQELSAPCTEGPGVKTSSPQGSVGLSPCSLVGNSFETILKSEGLKRVSGSGSEGEVDVAVKKSKRKGAGAEVEAKAEDSSSDPGLLSQHYSVAGAEIDDEIPDCEVGEGEMIELPGDLTRQQEDDLLGLGVVEDVEVRVKEMDTEMVEPEESGGGSSRSLSVTDGRAPAVVNETKVIQGFGVVEYTPQAHPFAKYQGTFNEELPACPIERMERRESLIRIQAFRDVTRASLITKVRVDPSSLKLDQTADTLYAFDFTSSHSVLYTVIKVRNTGAYLTPVKLEVVAGTRPDLHTVVLTTKSIDILSGKYFTPSSLYKGDLVIVEALVPRQEFEGKPIPTSWEYIKNPEEHTYWEVKVGQLVRRIVKKSKWALAIDEEEKKRGRTFSKGDDISFLVQDVLEVALFPKKHLKVKRETLSDFVVVDVVVPAVQPGRFCRSYNPSYSEECEVLITVQQHNNIWRLQPTVLSVYAMGDEDRAMLNDSKSWFQKGVKPTAEQFTKLAEITRFGVVTATAMSSYKYDPRAYKAEVLQVEKSVRFCILAMELESPASEKVSPGRWLKGTSVVLGFRNHIDVPATVVSSSASELGLALRVKLIRVGDAPSNISTELPLQVIIRQRRQNPQDNVRRAIGNLETPPCAQDSHAMHLLAQVHGGQTEPAAPLEMENFPFTIGSFTPTQEQSRVYHLIRAPEWRGAILECGPGVGKTTAVVTAIIRNVEVFTAGAGLSVGTGATNASVSQLVRSLRSRDIKGSVRYVRLVTAANLMKLDSVHHSKNDFPHLWVSVLREYLVKHDSANSADKTDMLECACRHLCARGEYAPRNLKSTWLYEQVTQRNYKTDPPKLSIMELLFNIYDPHLVIGTSDSIRSFFTTNEYLSSLRETVEMVWIDECSQLGRAQLVPLCFTFHRAKMVMVGDAKQLPPFREQQYPSRLNSLKNGPLFAQLVAEKLIPTLTLTRVYRCPTQLVELFSNLFYGNTLVAHKKPQKCQPFQSLGLPDDHPVLILDTCSGDVVEGTSRSNDQEAELAVRWVKAFREKNPKKSVGILAFYAAQAAKVAQKVSPEITVATIDGSQGNEFDMVVLLTSLAPQFRNNKFIEDPFRLCVALSRAKEALVIMCNKKSAVTSTVWSKIVDSVPENHRFQRGDTPLFTI